MAIRKLNLVAFAAAMVAAVLLQVSIAQQTHVVGDALAWSVPTGGAAAYSTWAAQKTFSVGDILVFTFTTGVHSVAEVSKAAFDTCNKSSPISLSSNGPTNTTLRSTGSHYYICTVGSHCGLGQKLAINVSAASASPAPQPAAPPTATPVTAPSTSPVTAPAPSRVAVPASAPTPTSAAQTFVVGGNMGWTVPAGGPGSYQTWANGKTFNVGDTLVFNFENVIHNVATVNKAAFNSCNTASPINTVSTGPARITLTSSGEHFYLCTFPRHCSLGQKLAINVTGTTTAPTPSTATPPSGSTIPSGESPVASPPPPSASAPSLILAALPFTFVSLALASLLN